MKDPILVVLAAGMGSRYGGLKQMESIGKNGEIILDYSIHDALKAGFKRVVFIIRKDFEELFKEKVGKNIEKLMETQYVFQSLEDLPGDFTKPAERTKPWGTGHAMLVCKDVIDAPFGIINADDYYGTECFSLLYDFLSTAESDDTNTSCNIGYRLSNTLSEHGGVTRGVCETDGEKNLTGIRERFQIQKIDNKVSFLDNETRVEVSPDAVVSMNMWGFTPAMMKAFDERFNSFLEKNLTAPKSEFIIPTVIGEMIDEKAAQVKVIATEDKWFGITFKEDLPLAKENINTLITKGIYPEKLY